MTKRAKKPAPKRKPTIKRVRLHEVVSFGWTAGQLVEALARLRLACGALCIEPSDVRLGDLDPAMAKELLRPAGNDLRELINGQ